MKVGLQITKNQKKFSKLLSLLNDKEYKDFSFIHIADNKDLSNNIEDLDILVCYGISPNIFNLRSEKLKWIHIGASGIEENLFNDVLKSRVMITNSKGINSKPVAEFIMAQILYFSKRFKECTEFKASRVWNQWDLAKQTTQLSESTLGIIGYGEIGKELSKLAKPFGMRVLATRRLQKKVERKKLVDALMPTSHIETILKESDYIAIACPLTPLTENLINKKSFSLMKNNAILINTSRGKVINEKDFISALSANQIRGAALDVYSQEPLNPKSELFNLDNVFLSPHISGNFSSYQENMIKQFGDMLIKFINNKSIKNRVCKKRLY